MTDREPQFDYPYGEYDALRMHEVPAECDSGESLARVHLPYGGDAWLARRYAHARAVLTHPGFGRAAAVNADVPRATARTNPYVSLPLLDAPEHTRQRGLVSKAFTARRIAELRPRIEQIVDELLDRMIAGGKPADMVDGMAWPLPGQVISELLGVPFEDRKKFQCWVDAAISVTAHTDEETQQAMIDLLTYFGEMAGKRRADPRGDLITRLVRVADEEGGLTEGEIAMFGVVLLIGGYETTACMFGNTIYTLLTHPEEMAKLVADPGLVGSAVEEMLRCIPFNASAALPTIAKEDIDIAGTRIEAGDAVFMDLARVNRDPEVFEDPDRVDITRTDNPHLAFGVGPHRCLGAQLARLELNVALEAVVRRLPGLALAVPESDLRWKQGRQFRSLEQLPVTWS